MTPEEAAKVKQDYPKHILSAARRIEQTFNTQLGFNFSAEQFVRILNLLGEVEDVINE